MSEKESTIEKEFSRRGLDDVEIEYVGERRGEDWSEEVWNVSIEVGEEQVETFGEEIVHTMYRDSEPGIIPIEWQASDVARHLKEMKKTFGESGA